MLHGSKHSCRFYAVFLLTAHVFLAATTVLPKNETALDLVFFVLVQIPWEDNLSEHFVTTRPKMHSHIPGELLLHITQDRAIYRNPPVHNFTGDKKKTRQVVDSPTFKYFMFLRRYKENIFFFCGHKVLAERVFVSQLSSNTGISV